MVGDRTVRGSLSEVRFTTIYQLAQLDELDDTVQQAV